MNLPTSSLDHGIWVALIYSVPGWIAAILGVVNAMRQNINHTETKQDMKEILQTTNGKMDRLLQVTGDQRTGQGCNRRASTGA